MVDIYRAATIAVQHYDFDALGALERHVSASDIPADERRALCILLEAIGDVIYEANYAE